MTIAWEPGTWTEARRAELARLWMQPLTQIEIATDLNTSPCMVTKYARLLGLPKRTLNDNTTWTPKQIDQLRVLWAEGLSTRIIAQRIGGGLTKNSVIGKAGRLKLSPRQNGRYGAGKGRGPRPLFVPVGGRAPRKISFTPRPAPALRPTPLPPPKIEPDGPPMLKLTILQLTEHTCKYPTGEATGGSQLFCGAVKGAESAYCVFHHKLCWHDLPKRDKRRQASHVEYLADKAA